MKNFVTGSTRLVNVSVCSSFNTSGYGKTCEVCNWPWNKFIVNDFDVLRSFFDSVDSAAKFEVVVDSHLLTNLYILIGNYNNLELLGIKEYIIYVLFNNYNIGIQYNTHQCKI